ncbi:MAG: rod-binding protein [Bdellovibrionota bacterium]
MAVGKLDKVYYPPPVNKDVETQFKDAAKMYEKQFLGEMVKAMRTTVQESGLVNVSNGEKIFKQQLDDEYVDQWTNKGGIGMADMIYDQLMQKYGGQNIQVKPKGPLDMKDAAVFKGSAVMPKAGQTDITFSRPAGSKDIVSVQSPWDGVLREKTSLGSDGYLLKIDHADGLSSRLSFRGTAGTLEKGQKIQAGQKIGLLSPEANEFFWSLGEGTKTPVEELGDTGSL